MSEKTAASAGKDVIYIDVDDEITGIIDKVQGGKQKIVALVLPKRATMFQSIVNMKLLKRASDEAKKNIVLITSEAGLMPLAGTVGLHVARSLQSKPEVPDGPAGARHAEDIEDADEDDEQEPESASAADEATPPVDKTRTVGELAGAAALEDQMGDDDDAIDLNDEEEPEEQGAAGSDTKSKSVKGKNKKLKIPNFNKFRLLLIAGGAALVALIVFAYFALAVLPKATIAVKTDSSAVNSSLVTTLKTGNTVTLDPATNTVPATSQQTQKTQNQQVPATGQQNNGQKASGSVTMSAGACSGSVPSDVPAGVGLSGSGLTFITQQNTSFTPVVSHGKCTFQSASATTVVAQNGGSQYNIGAATFTVAGRSDVSASSSSSMTGGTDDITKIVTQSDIDNAKQKINSQDADSIKQELKSGLIAKGLFAIDASFNAGTPDVKTSANPGDAAENVTVTETITYSMLGAKESDLQKLIKNDVKGKIDLSKQQILDYGMNSAVFGLQTQNPDGAAVTMQTTVVVGSELNVATIKKQVAGKKGGDAKSIIKQNPGVTDVTVTYSPFWVSSIPKNTSKITINVQKPTVSTKSNASNP
jgi:hypothetical protein